MGLHEMVNDGLPSEDALGRARKICKLALSGKADASPADSIRGIDSTRTACYVLVFYLDHLRCWMSEL
jgi:hypothetical protein